MKMRMVAFLWVLAGVFFLASTVVDSAENKDYGGWELNSPYNQHYKASELDYFKAEVIKVTETVPMTGMSPGVVLQVKESDGEAIDVHVCPSWYMNPADVGLKRGDKVKIRGVWAEIDGKDVFMASKIKKGDYFVLKVRLTKDGVPFWTMTPEQLAQEQQGDSDR